MRAFQIAISDKTMSFIHALKSSKRFQKKARHNDDKFTNCFIKYKKKITSTKGDSKEVGKKTLKIDFI